MRTVQLQQNFKSQLSDGQDLYSSEMDMNDQQPQIDDINLTNQLIGEV